MRRRFLAVAVAALTIDLLSKAAASAWLPDRRIDLPGPVNLRLVHNPGVAFGVGRAAPAWLIVVITSVVVVGLAVAAWRGTFASPVGVGLVLGGAVANVADRVQAGSVVDMLYTGWWPTFNVADIWITVGVGLLVLGELRRGSADREDERSTADKRIRSAS